MLKTGKAAGAPQPPTPLSVAEKKQIIKFLKTIDSKFLKPALVESALALMKFPQPLANALTPFYTIALMHQENKAILEPLKISMQAYLNDKGLDEFKALLNEEFSEENWPAEFLRFIAEYYEFPVTNAPFVQVTIKDAKVYWRILKGDKERFRLSGHEDIDFDKEVSWKMTWKQFRLFKDSGKRGSTVAITQARFKSYFRTEFHAQAEVVWTELKKKGLLDNKDRLSDAWRVISNTNVELASLTDPVQIISKRDVLKCINKLTKGNLQKSISREKFVGWWDEEFQYRAGLIWDHLKEKEILNDTNQILDLKFPLTNLLNELHLNYQDVVEAIYDICNNKEYKSTIADFPRLSKFREERSVKTWMSNGKINNGDPKTATRCTKLFDVSTYDDLYLHRHTPDEKKEGAILEYDHIPSSGILKNNIKASISKRKISLKQAKKTHKELLTKRDEKKEKKLTELTTDKKVTRSFDKVIKQEPWYVELNKQIANAEKKIASIKLELKHLRAELQKHGPLWWTIAIPHKLHQHGNTYMKSNKEQFEDSQHFLKEIIEYFNELENPQKYLLTSEDLLLFIGALRYLYKQNYTAPTQILGQYSIGNAPHTFFQDSKARAAIDETLNKEMQKFLLQREGAPYQEGSFTLKK